MQETGTSTIFGQKLENSITTIYVDDHSAHPSYAFEISLVEALGIYKYQNFLSMMKIVMNKMNFIVVQSREKCN